VLARHEAFYVSTKQDSASRFVLALDNRHATQTRSCALTTDRSAVRLNRLELRQRPTQLVKVERSIQTLIFNHQSACAVFCSRSYYFFRPEPLKITKSASSSTPSQEKDRQISDDQNADKADGHRTRHSSLSIFKSDAQSVVQVSKYNRFENLCKPPVFNRLQRFRRSGHAI
jgi:hypothetical protein